MADARTTLSTVLYCIWWPFSHILSAARAILSPFWALAQFVFLPVVYLVQGLLVIVLLPFRLHVLERIEVCVIIQPTWCSLMQWHPTLKPMADYLHMARRCEPHRLHHRRSPVHRLQIPVLRPSH